MKNKLLFLIFSFYLLLFAGPAKAEGVLSDQAFASLVTCGAGAEVESFFHSDWFEAISDLDGQYLLKRTREIIKRSLRVKIHKDNRARLNI